jgi:hypothetical protein
MPTYIGVAPSPIDLWRSPYYWWWMYLKLNKHYEETCQRKGQGPCAELYKDFGDVRPDGDDAFFAWWGERGELRGRLFQERTVMPKAVLLKNKDDWTPVMGRYPCVVIAVDLHMGIRAAEKMIADELPRHFNKQQGRTPMPLRFSTARYKLSDYGRESVFRNCYLAYIALHDAVEKYGAVAKIPAKEFSARMQRVDVSSDFDAQELYEKATELIEWVGKGSFPGPPLEEFKDWERKFDELVRETGMPIHYMD